MEVNFIKEKDLISQIWELQSVSVIFIARKLLIEKQFQHKYKMS
jgi:hypothetical protein